MNAFCENLLYGFWISLHVEIGVVYFKYCRVIDFRIWYIERKQASYSESADCDFLSKDRQIT
jgi:hypothetical protein